jgi:hypothetical protein
MLKRFASIVACAVLSAVMLAGQAAAQSPTPSPSPAATPVAFSARAHAAVTVVTDNGTYGGTVQLGLAERANQTRIDVLAIKSDSFPVPPLTVTVVIDRGANTLTAWSDTTKLYRVQPFIPRASASATPRPNATPAARGTSPFAKLDVLSATLKLTGHTTTAGLPTTSLSFDLQVQNKGDKAPSHVVATTQLADEFAIFPVTADISVEPGMVPFGAKLSYAVDDLTRGMPPAATFTIPAGYREAPSMLGVIFPGRSVRMPSPRPSRSPSPERAPRG